MAMSMGYFKPRKSQIEVMIFPTVMAGYFKPIIGTGAGNLFAMAPDRIPAGPGISS